MGVKSKLRIKELSSSIAEEKRAVTVKLNYIRAHCNNLAPNRFKHRSIPDGEFEMVTEHNHIIDEYPRISKIAKMLYREWT